MLSVVGCASSRESVTAISAVTAALSREPCGGVRFTSEPAGAEVFVDGGYFGKTPVTAKLTRDQDYAVRFHSEGYLDQTYRFTLRDCSVHGVLDPIGGVGPTDAHRTGTDPGWGSAERSEPSPKEGSRLLVLPDAPVTIVLEDGSVLAARGVEPSGIGYVKIYLTDGKTKYVANNKIRTIATRAPADWTRAVLERGMRIRPR